MAKQVTFRFEGKKQNEHVKGEITAKNNLDAIRILKYEMGVDVILEVKKNRSSLLETIAKVNKKKDPKEEKEPAKIRKIATVTKNKIQNKEGVKKALINISTNLGKLSKAMQSNKVFVLNQEELDKAVEIARDSIFKSIEQSNAKGDKSNTTTIIKEKVVYVPSSPSSPLANYTQVRSTDGIGGLGGELKEKLQHKDDVDIKLDWSILDRTKPKATSKIKMKELVLFSHKMAVLIRSGILLLDALYIVKDSFKRKLVIHTIDSLTERVQNGESLSEAMANYPSIFDEFYIAVINVGESVGNLAGSFEDLTKLYKTKLSVRKKAKSASIYPLVVLGFLIILLFAASKFFLPQFKSLFTSSGIQMPGFTAFVFNLADHIPNIITWAVVIFLVNMLAYKYIPGYNKYVNIAKDYIASNVPVIKKYTQIMAMYNFSSTMQIILKNGISLINAIELSTRVIQNIIYKVQIGSLRGCVTEGMSFAEAVSHLDKMDQFTISMIRIGEESGNLAAAFQNINEYQQESLKEFTDLMIELMQPLIILLLAGIVVPIIIAVYIPLIQMTSGNGATL